MDKSQAQTATPSVQLLDYSQIRSSLLEDIKLILVEREEQALSKQLFSPEAACNLFEPKICRSTLKNWERDGYLEPPQKIGGKVFYSYAQIMKAGSRITKYKKPEIQK